MSQTKTRYYTFRKDVPLKKGWHVQFLEGHGYYAAIGNPSPFPGPDKPPHVDPDLRTQIVHYANAAVLAQGNFSYTQSALRSQFFHRKPGDFRATVRADCSQFVATLLNWVGAKGLTDTDYTGTLLAKGKSVKEPQPGDAVVWGPRTGTHTAFYVGDGWTIGFGHSPGAPNRVTLAAMTAYFAHSHPGVRYLSFLPKPTAKAV